jgi:hypothetical protein
MFLVPLGSSGESEHTDVENEVSDVGAELPPSPSAMAGPSEARSAKADARPETQTE